MWLCRWSAVDMLESKYTPWSPYCYIKCNPINDTDSKGMGGDRDTRAPQESPEQLEKNKIDYQGNDSLKFFDNGSGGFMYLAQGTNAQGEAQNFWIGALPLDNMGGFQYYYYDTYKITDGDRQTGWVPFWNDYDIGKAQQQAAYQLADAFAIGLNLMIVGAVAAPAAIELIASGALSTSASWVWSNVIRSGSQATWEILKIGYQKIGKDFLMELGKEIVANRGNLNEVDLFDVAISTVASKLKLNWAGKLLEESVNATTDISIDSNGNLQFQSTLSNNKLYTKDIDKATLDFLIALPKIGTNATFDEIKGTNESRDLFIDVLFDQYRSQIQINYEKR